MPCCLAYHHDFDALRAASTRIVLVRGEGSGEQVAARAATAVAGRLGTTPAIFPGTHDGFLGGEYGSTGKPEAFAAALCGVLTEVAAELAQDRTARCCGTSVRT